MGFDPKSTKVATGSMDTTAKVWDVETGAELCTLNVSCLLSFYAFSFGRDKCSLAKGEGSQSEIIY